MSTLRNWIRTQLNWLFVFLTRVGVLVSLAVGLVSLLTNEDPIKVITNITVAIENTSSFVVEATSEPFPITNEDVEFFIAWACTQMPDHERC